MIQKLILISNHPYMHANYLSFQTLSLLHICIKTKSKRENLLWVHMVQTNNKMIVNERFGCRYTQIKV
uniref:Uncharacterized protein n=1 Tax=Aegilops tauschii subsp. strangulata TaxID=200361 RepID=A0A453NKG5_AEGTS